MRRRNYIKIIACWFGQRDDQRKPNQDQEFSELSAITELVAELKPEQGLLNSIEEEIDQRSATGEKSRHIASFFSTMRMWIAATTAGMALGIFAHYGFIQLSQSTQSIIVQTSAKTNWVSLGQVHLDGSLLRAYVKTKCSNYTHLSILLKGEKLVNLPPDKTSMGALGNSNVMQPEEKILMDCIH